MYKILRNIQWCGKTFTEGMFYDFPEATRPEQLDALVAKGLIEKAPESKKAAPVQGKPIPSKTETRHKKGRR